MIVQNDNSLNSFMHPHVISNLHVFLSFVVPKIIYLRKNVSVDTNSLNVLQNIQFNASHKKENHRGLDWYDDESKSFSFLG